MTWYKPVAKSPARSARRPSLLEKKTKKEGEILVCNAETCDYKVAVETASV